MSDTTIYTKSETGKKWHIQHNRAWTLCYQHCSAWEVSDFPGGYTSQDYGVYNGILGFWESGESEIEIAGEVCRQCQQIDEAIRTGEGIPF